MHTLHKLIQFTVSAILESSYYQFRKVHHFSVSHTLFIIIIITHVWNLKQFTYYYDELCIIARGTCSQSQPLPPLYKSLRMYMYILILFLFTKYFFFLKIDPSLIGGLIVDIGDKYIDMSTATKIKKIVQNLQEGL